MPDNVPSTNSLTNNIYGNSSSASVQSGIDGNSVMPASGYYGNNWPSRSGAVIPQGVSAGGWTVDPTTPNTFDRGYKQQTFLGASIRNFSMNGGFGDSSSTLSMELIADEYNKSDGNGIGYGDDPYHNGVNDNFVPPIAGSPVFFKFGPNLATVEEAYRNTFDKTYRYNTIGNRTIVSAAPFDKENFTSLANNQYVNLESNTVVDFSAYLNNPSRGADHITFGGILQSYVQNRGPGGNPLYSVQVTDPREILSNVVLVLNNYAGTVFNTQNVFNIYGFLEHNMTAATSGALQSQFRDYNVLTKYVNPTNGFISYSGSKDALAPLDCWFKQGMPLFGSSGNYQSFPLTGTGFSRRGPQGIPYYRVAQAVNALMSIDYTLPTEYKNRGFGKVINFRGYNYVVDFGGLPTLPSMYYLDFDQVNLLDLALEICEVTSRDLFVSLLPVINHPACQFLYNNQGSNQDTLIAGIIRLDSIDRSHAPVYGAIKRYIDSLSASGITVENQDVGYELSNVTTDKFVVGAQEVDMYCFSSNGDRDTSDVRTKRSGKDAESENWKQWTLDKQLEQQILPYYGTLGQNAVTIPKGWGAYQQILLDSTGLNAKGVGAYYVATEMELRCASVSYECWKNFLQQYNDIYLESIEDNDSVEGSALDQTPQLPGINLPVAPNISNNYAVTVPRSVFETYADQPFGKDKLPKSPCNPPYGYPLYYKRMTKIGIPEGGLTKLQARITGLLTASAQIRGADADSYQEIKNNLLKDLEYIVQEYGSLTPQEKDFYNALSTQLALPNPDFSILNNIEESLHKVNAIFPRLAKKGTENALKVYQFLKKIADENLGKKFLVRIPNKVNFNYENNVAWNGSAAAGKYKTGPFGFRPRSISANPGDDFSASFLSGYRSKSSKNMFSFLSNSTDANQNSYIGALKSNFNPVSEKFEFNYAPSNIGGYLPFDLYANTLTFQQISSLPVAAVPRAVSQGLVPQDITNFLDENGRISPYVRFDNSQYLSFGSINSEDFTQQLITPSGMIPDLCEFLDNTGDDTTLDFVNMDADRPDNNNTSKQCAFVKCSLDEKFYMPPKTSVNRINIYGDTNCTPKIVRPKKIFIPCSGWRDGIVGQTPLVDGTGVYVDSYRYLESHYVANDAIITAASRLTFNKQFYPVLNSYLVKTEISDLDTNYVYALITLPNKIIPTKDARYRDSINQKHNGYQVKHYLTMDVVKGLPEFNYPPYVKKAAETNILGNDARCTTFPAQIRSIAWLASKKAKENLQFGLSYSVDMVAPSPVIPDLVVLPLISQERCYGPWVSSQVDPQGTAYSNIGGRVEFIKDENLSPWNYAGYELMHKAGVLQAQFANSLLLFSERGGFSYPGLPTTSLGTTLLSDGPLVTNISVDMSDGGVKTTYKMDLYTSSFGKLQKQKQDMISKISRERQKLRDERNALVRKGIGKAQTNVNTIGEINLYGNDGVKPSQTYSSQNIVASVLQYESSSYVPAIQSSETYPSKDNVHSASMKTDNEITDMMNTFDDEIQRNVAEYNAGSASMSDMYLPYSNEPYHPNMANIQYRDYRATNRLYETPDFLIDDDNITPPV